MDMCHINLNSFISKHVIKRSSSMFQKDMDFYKEELIERINGRSVLVIGGAGSIGSSFIKALLPYHPYSLVVVDINENALTELTRDLRSTKGIFIPEDYKTYAFDYNSHVFQKMFRAREGFDIVANFSAHKHVRSEKDIYSIEALLRNNVINAENLLDVLSEFPPEEYFCVSTDKAANPVNIMGASKRIMEDLIFSYSDIFPVKTARFANVAFSNGSLPDGFLSRISKNQPLSAPSDTRRFFVSMEESGQICLLSCILGKNREILFPKIAESQMMTFDIIAKKLLEESGYEVMECESELEAIELAEGLANGSNKYPVYFSRSDTSGEKLYEEFVTDLEMTDMNRFTSLGVIVGKELPDKTKLDMLIKDLTNEFDNETTKEKIVKVMKMYLPDFEHIETGKTLDSKM